METLSPETVEKAVRSLVVAERLKYGIEVSTTVAYPGGDLVLVVVEQTPSGIIVHDAGAAAERLTLLGISIGRDVHARLTLLASRFECAFEDRRVAARSEISSLELAVAMVANASRAVADYAVELRRHVEADFRAIVAEALREIVGARLRENDEFIGSSGRKYRVSAVILDNKESEPMNFVAPVANRSNVSNTFAMLYDLHGKFPDAQPEAIYDDASDLREEDKALLHSIGSVYTLSEARQQFRKIMGVPLGNA